LPTPLPLYLNKSEEPPWPVLAVIFLGGVDSLTLTQTHTKAFVELLL